MIAQVLRLTNWEWFKLRRRWMPWILLAVAVVFVQIGVWVAYTAYHNETLQELTSGGSSSFGVSTEVDGELVSVDVSCVDLVEGRMPPEIDRLPENERQAFLEDMERFLDESCGNVTARDTFREGFVLPSAATEAIKGALGIAPILVMILAGSIVGTEYGMGTLRTVLTRGTGRWPLLSSKLVLLVLIAAAGLVAISLITAVASVVAALIPPSEEGGIADVGKWSDLGVTFVKAVYALAPYLALGALLAVLTQSSAVSISTSLGYYVIELIATPLLGLNETLEKVTDFIIGSNVNEWMESAFVTVEVNGSGGVGEQPDTLWAFLVILAYTVVLAGVAFWIFQRRDIAGARGE